MSRIFFLAITLAYLTITTLEAQVISQTPPEFRLKTQWSEDVNPDLPHQEYPRPNMRREEWSSLNGRWYFEITPKEAGIPTRFKQEIIVPFPVESALSRIQQDVSPEDKLWYKRTFFIPEEWSGRFVLLHFGASDWETTVYINGTEIGQHRGGYDAFTLDISGYLDERGVQEIVVSVWDPTDSYHQPRGKQKINPGGIWYTPVSGIWQSVWIEPVNFSYINSYKCTPDIDQSTIDLEMEVENGVPGDTILADITFQGRLVASAMFPFDQHAKVNIPNPSLWSTQTPYLYDIQFKMLRDGEILDGVKGYFGMRKIEVSQDAQGIRRLFLNNQPIFQLGLLDQGWWPDGLYAAPSDEALKSDIIRTKEMGFNVIRKHVKVEPQRWYYHCDQLGMLVWQDMPNSDKNAEWDPPSGIDGVEIEREFVSEAQYKIEFEEIITELYNHPSIIKWIPFNEGWGQFKTEEIYPWVSTIDSTRLLGGPSGGNYFPVGDTRDYHKYPGPEMPPEDPERALILGEFGGLGLPLEGHLWQPDKNWGYINIKRKKDLLKAYLELMHKLKPMLKTGLAGAIYTQTTDVEGEVNGLMTYDREVIKMKPKKLSKAHDELYEYFHQVVKKGSSDSN